MTEKIGARMIDRQIAAERAHKRKLLADIADIDAALASIKYNLACRSGDTEAIAAVASDDDATAKSIARRLIRQYNPPQSRWCTDISRHRDDMPITEILAAEIDKIDADLDKMQDTLACIAITIPEIRYAMQSYKKGGI